MKGTDVTEEQLKHAEEFVLNSQIRGYDGPEIRIRKEDFYRLIAWYAAMRLESENGKELGPIKSNRAEIEAGEKKPHA